MTRLLAFAATLFLACFALIGGAMAAPLKVALLLSGMANDGSFNQAAADAARKLEAEGKIKADIREDLSDPSKSEPVIRQYAAMGYDLVIGHGIELSDPILKIAKSFPKTHFVASGGPDLAQRLLPNVDGWTYDFGQQGYLAGLIAGEIGGVELYGMVGGPELGFVKAAHAGFKAGLAETDPAAKVTEVFTGSFDDAQRAAEVTRGMISSGAKVVWTSGDGIGNGVAAAAAQAGATTLGVTGEAGGNTAKVNLASVVLDMSPSFDTYVADIAAGNFGGKFLTSGIANGGLVLTPLNTAVPAKLAPDAAGKIAAIVDKLKAGTLSLPNFFN